MKESVTDNYVITLGKNQVVPGQLLHLRVTEISPLTPTNCFHIQRHVTIDIPWTLPSFKVVSHLELSSPLTDYHLLFIVSAL